MKENTYSDTTQLVNLLLTAAWYWQAENPHFIKLKNGQGIYDQILLMTSKSERHSQTLADDFTVLLKKTDSQIPTSTFGRQEGHWVLIEHGSLCIHILLESVRQHLALEELFAKHEHITWDETTYQSHFSSYKELLQSI